jgi:hypothetical protein
MAPTEARRFVDQCEVAGVNVIDTFAPKPSRIDQPNSDECRYYYWSDGSRAVYDYTLKPPTAVLLSDMEV